VVQRTLFHGFEVLDGGAGLPAEGAERWDGG
jgi:hypothetical protein